MLPTNPIIVSRISLSESVFNTDVSLERTLPVVSCVSVEMPSLNIATYSFVSSVSISTSFVALPTQTGRTPTASGSRVPVCPIFLVFNILRSRATTSNEVIPASLYTLITPFILSVKLHRDRIRQVVHDIMERSVHRKSCSPYMSAAVIELGYLGHINISSRAE